MSSVAAIVLAAGASLRLDTPKQLVRLGAETLLERAVRVALEAGLDPVYGVVPADLFGNDRPDRSGAVVLACDQPAVTAGHLRELASGGDDLVASSYAGRKGIPAYFPRAAFAALLALRGDVGARALLQDARAIPLADGELDIDTMEDLDRARKLYSTGFRRG